MRIAFVVGSFPDISNTFILDQITGLLDLGHDVEVYARTPEPGQVQHAAVARYGLIARTHYWESTPLATARDTAARTLRMFARAPGETASALVRSLARPPHAPASTWRRQWPYVSTMLSQRAPDVVLAHFGTNGAMAQRLRDLGATRAPLVTVFHGHDVSRVLVELGPAFYERLFARGDCFLPVSDYFRARLIAAGCPAERTHVHRMGVDTASFSFRARTRAAHEPTRFVTVCRMVEKKGLEYAVRAMGELKARGLAFTWDVAGDGPLRPRLEALRTELGLASHVTLHGTVARAEVQELLDRAHVFVQPSVTAEDGDQEGVPVAIMEAMAVGMPVVTTRHSGIPELVEHGVSGYLVGEREVGELAARLHDIAHEPERWPSMGASGREKVARDFDITTLNRELATKLAAQCAAAR